MRSASRVLLSAILIFGAGQLSACATFTTISAAEPGTAKVFSGTRLNVIAIRGEEPSARRFKVVPPANPLLDLPLSFALDVVILPLTLPVATHEVVFR